jgi:hypothetical protein
MFIVGAHLRNQARLPQGDAILFHAARFDGAVAFSYQDPAVVADLTYPPNCVVRLPDSIFTDWAHDPTGHTKRIPGSREYADTLVAEITRWYTRGFRLFQPDNEPNWSWKEHTTQGAWEWAYFMDEVLYHPDFGVTHRIPVDAWVGFTPLATGDPAQPDTLEATWWAAAKAHNLQARADFIALHCYWQAAGDMRNPAFGAKYEPVSAEFPDKALFITEAGNSLIQSVPRPTIEQCTAAQAVQYPDYIRQLQAVPAVWGVYFYILGSNGDWAGFEMTPPVLNAIGAVSRGEGMEYLKDFRARNFTNYRNRQEKFIVVHITEGTEPSDVLWLCGDHGVSAHVYIDHAGHAHQLVPFNLAAWHCGIRVEDRAWKRTNRPDIWSIWGDENENTHSIGIEVSSPKGQPMSAVQFATLVEVVADLVKRFHIPLDRRYIVGHYELNTQKQDPPGFDWSAFMSQVRAKVTPAAPPPPAPPPTVRYYPQTGHSIKGPFLEFFDAHGGIGMLGYPLTDEQQEGELIVQYLENVRLEFRPNTPGYPRQGAVARMYLQSIGRLPR